MGIRVWFAFFLFLAKNNPPEVTNYYLCFTNQEMGHRKVEILCETTLWVPDLRCHWFYRSFQVQTATIYISKHDDLVLTSHLG